MIKVTFPEGKLKLREHGFSKEIFDPVRKLWIVLTPEEWVRQNFVSFLTSTHHYPSALIAIEKEIRVGELKKRCDIVVYAHALPWMIIECKEMNVSLSEGVLAQVLRYHAGLPANYLIITNGKYTFGYEKKAGSLREISALPEFGALP